MKLRKSLSAVLLVVGLLTVAYNIWVTHVLKSHGFGVLQEAPIYPVYHPARVYDCLLRHEVFGPLGSGSNPTEIASLIGDVIGDQMMIGLFLVITSMILWSGVSSYRFGYLFGGSALILIARFFLWPRPIGGMSIVANPIIAVMIFSAIQILRKKQMGWIIFIAGAGLMTGFCLFTSLNAFLSSIIHTVACAIWLLIGGWYWARNRRRFV